MSRLPALLLLLVLSSCSAWVPTRTGQHYDHPSRRLSVTLNEGWYRYSKTSGGLLFTRSGMPLGYIEANRWTLKRAPLENTERRLAAGMTALEASEVVLDELRSNPQFAGLTLLEVSPATLSGAEGFRLRADYRPVNGPSRRLEVQGMIWGTVYVELRYDAPAQVYFDAHYADFQAMAETLRLR